MKEKDPKKVLEALELSALENETIKGGNSKTDVKSEKKKEKKSSELSRI